jgi:hypothetical protein
MGHYEVLITRRGQALPLQLRIVAENRRRAVYKAEQWFWRKYKGAHGPAHRAMTVSDPCSEVHYHPGFSCCDRMNKLLPVEVIDRLLVESKGELTRETRVDKPHGQHTAVRRVKRRRDFGVFVAPALRRMRNGVLYYRIITSPQGSRNGRRFRKRKYRDIRLMARTLSDAVAEIHERRLNHEDENKISRRMKVREEAFVAHVAGLLTLSPRARAKYARVLPKYEEPRARLCKLAAA